MNSAIWAWIVLAIVIILFVTGYDLWAYFTNHITMSGQFHKWLTESTAGAIVIGLWVAIPVGLLYHFTILKKK